MGLFETAAAVGIIKHGSNLPPQVPKPVEHTPAVITGRSIVKQACFARRVALLLSSASQLAFCFSRRDNNCSAYFYICSLVEIILLVNEINIYMFGC